jgi:hypothetical protein
MRKLFATFFIYLAISSVAHADSWADARIQVRASADGQYLIRVIPGKSMGDVHGFSGLPKGPYATAEWHKFDGTSYVKVRTVTLLNPIAPVDIKVTNSGSLVTIDNWHNVGIGSVVAIYSASGQLVKKYSLSDLFPPKDLAQIPRSVSSIHWRCHRDSYMFDSETELWIEDSIGGRFVFNPTTGTFEHKRGFRKCE